MKNNNQSGFLEEDLYTPVRNYLESQGFYVRSEVKHCDIAAVKDGELIVVELKKNLSIELLVQAVNRQKFAEMVYIAVPKPKRLLCTRKWGDTLHLLRRLELGLILVSLNKQSELDIVLHPTQFDRQKSRKQNQKKRVSVLKEIAERQYELNKGGSKGKQLMTAYREKAVFIAYCLLKYGPLSPKRLREYGTDSKKTTSILSANHYGWFCRVKNGVYDITETGKECMTHYPELTEYYEKVLEKQYKKSP